MNTSKESSAQPQAESSSIDETAQPSTAAEPASEPSAPPEPIENLIRTVAYSKLKNLGNYENEAVEASAYCLQTEDPAEVLEQLRVWVHSQLGVSMDELWDRRQQAKQLQDQVWALESRADSLKGDIEKMRAWAAGHGAHLLQSLEDPLPF